ncbi:MAG: prepilin-type N-terminal cleavage/methylation domain-containing protein [Halanaerobiales bacterium]|nr:prepilin-type N-terminal cleavage/methylation domain-containing protein [Halanaerobiales bacterium]
MKKILQLKEEKGITLVELLMVMAVFGILMIAIQTIFTVGMDVFHIGREDTKIRSQSYIAVENIMQAIRNTPTTGIELRGTNGTYDEIVLNSLAGEQGRFFLQGNQLQYEKDGTQRMVAEGIERLEFLVVCDSFAGSYDSYTQATLRIDDSDDGFANLDPDIKGMVIRFENVAGSVARYIYRKIVDYGEDWIEIDSDFASGFSPTNRNYAIGNTYQIYLRTERSDHLQAKDFTTGVTPRF